MRARVLHRAIAAAVAAVVLITTLVAVAAARTSRRWRDLGAVPGAAMGFKPQGLTVAGRSLFFTQHHFDKAATLHRFDRDTLAVTGVAAMPPEATHPGGLAWDGATLWAVDYNSNRLYALDAERTFAAGSAVVRESYPTGLSRTSALAYLEVEGSRFLAISDFGPFARTYVIRLEHVAQLATRSLADVATLAYANGGFSQGLASDGHHLYEALNCIGRDEIRVLDLATAIRLRDPELVQVVARIAAPADDVEERCGRATRGPSGSTRPSFGNELRAF